MNKYFLVLDDNLIKLYHDFKRGVDLNTKELAGFLRYYRPMHKTNLSQLLRCNIRDTALLSALAADVDKDKSLEDLCNLTIFKYILTTERKLQPYLNIFSDYFTTEIVYSFNKGDERSPFLEHLKRLCQDAKYIFITDKYLNEGLARKLIDYLPENISIHLTYKSLELGSKLKKDFPKIGFKDNKHPTYAKLHDRYIRIENDIEIIITSGIDNLFDTTKDCTVIIRYLKEDKE